MARRRSPRCSATPTPRRSTFDEALLSTEYGEDGVQRRATLELWPDAEDGAAAARRRHADQLDHGQAPRPDAEIAFFRWSVEGREGLGHYEVARADG